MSGQSGSVAECLPVRALPQKAQTVVAKTSGFSCSGCQTEDAAELGVVTQLRVRI